MKLTVIHRSLLILTACLLAGTLCQARGFEQLPQNQQAKVAPVPSSVDDMVDSVPVLRSIPKSFIVGDGYKVKFKGMSLQIDHMGSNSNAPVSHRTCLISLTYMTPVAFFSSRIDFPLLTASSLTGNWSHSSLGDYVLNLSRDDVPHAGWSLSANIRF